MTTPNLHTQIRTALYERLVETGRAPTKTDLAQQLGITLEEIETVFRDMEEVHLVALQQDSGEILMAWPFSAVPTGFDVEANGVHYWANCIWDALGIPAALHADANIYAKCADCGEAMNLTIQAGRLLDTEGVIHFLVPPKDWFDDIVFT